MWHDADTWQTPYRILSLPFGGTIGDVLMAAQIAGGIALFFPQTMRPASIILGVVYALFSLAALPGIFAHPTNFGEYDGLCEQLSLLSAAIAVYVWTETKAARARALSTVARVAFGLCTVGFTLAQLIYLQFTASLVPKWIPPGQMFWAILTTVAFALAAIATLINRQARLALRLMALMLTLFGLLIWVPALIAQPGTHGNWSEFTINFLIAGAAWLVAETTTYFLGS